MTVSSETSRASYSGNDIVTAFPTTFRFLASADLDVILVDDVTGVETTQILDTDYTVAGVGDSPSGTVNMTVAPTTGETLVIVRSPDFTQLLDYIENGPFPAESHERGLDLLTMLVQRNKDILDRAMKFSEGDTSGVSTLMPSPVAGTVLGSKADESGYENKVLAGTGIIDVETISVNVTNMLELVAVDPTASPNVEMVGFFAVYPQSSFHGGGQFVWQSGLSKTLANGGTIIDPNTTGGFDGTTATLGAFLAAQGTGVGTGCWVRQYAGSINFRWFGAVGEGANDTIAFQGAIDGTYSRDNTIRIIGDAGGVHLLSGLQLPDASVILDLAGLIIDINGGDGILFPPTVSQNADIIPFSKVLNGYFIIKSNHSAIRAHSTWSTLLIPPSTISGNTFDVSTGAGITIDAIISLQGLISINIHNNTFYGNGSEVNYNGIVSTYTSNIDSSVMNVRIYDNMFKRINKCIVQGTRTDPLLDTVGRSEGWSIHDNSFIFCYGVCVTEERSLLTDIRGNTFTQISTGVIISGSHCSVVANLFEGIIDAGIKIQGGADYLVENTNAGRNVFKLFNNVAGDYDGAVAVKTINTKDFGIRGLSLSGSTIYGETDNSQNGIEFTGDFIHAAIDCTGITGLFLDSLFYSVVTTDKIRGRFTLENTELVNSKFNNSNPFKDEGGGTYTPTITGTNLDSATAVNTNYGSTGTVVTVFGDMTIDQTASGVTVLKIPLPIPSDFTASVQLAGKLERKSSPYVDYGYILADTVNDVAEVTINTTFTGAQSYAFSFQYILK